MSLNKSIDIIKLISYLLPSFLRKVYQITWLKVVLSHNTDTHEKALAYEKEIKEDLNYNGQTIALQYGLIEKFGGGIFITNLNFGKTPTFIGLSNAFNSPFIGLSNTSKSPFVGQTNHGIAVSNSSFNLSFNGSFDVHKVTDFTIHVPRALELEKGEVLQWVSRRVVGGLTFKVKEY